MTDPRGKHAAVRGRVAPLRERHDRSQAHRARRHAARLARVDRAVAGTAPRRLVARRPVQDLAVRVDADTRHVVAL